MRWPGSLSGVSEEEFAQHRKRVVDGSDTINEFVRYLGTNIINDLHELGRNVRRVYNLADVAPGETTIVLALNPDNADDIYHIYKRTPDYLWSHKPGYSSLELLDDNKNPFLGNYNDPDIIPINERSNYIPVAIFAYR